MYRPKFWCYSCRRERWPGDCHHGRSVEQPKSVMTKLDLCGHCGALAALCRANCKARADKALALKAAAAPLLGLGWMPWVDALERVISINDLASATFSNDGTWLIWRWFALCSPALIKTRPDWVKKFASDTSPKVDMPSVLVKHQTCDLAKERGRFKVTTAGGVVYQVTHFTAGARECYVQDHLVDVFRDSALTFALGCEGQGVEAPVLCVKNKFGAILGLVMPIRRDACDTIEPVVPKLGLVMQSFGDGELVTWGKVRYRDGKTV